MLNFNSVYYMVASVYDFIDKIKNTASSLRQVVPFTKNDGLLLMDFTDKNKELTTDIVSNTNRFIDYINLKLNAAGAKYGIGGYKENRTIYSRSKMFNADAINDEPRRLHLGVDIWGRPYTRVMAPMDGIVHSFAFNNAYGDYGATIILTHNLDNLIFHTLYGHLSLNSLKNLREGDTVKKGEVFTEFGIPFENGQWPPHLHFQIILDLADYRGDYPGVCKYSEKESYLSNCPDPDLILHMIEFAKPQWQ